MSHTRPATISVKLVIPFVNLVVPQKQKVDKNATATNEEPDKLTVSAPVEAPLQQNSETVNSSAKGKLCNSPQSNVELRNSESDVQKIENVLDLKWEQPDKEDDASNCNFDDSCIQRSSPDPGATDNLSMDVGEVEEVMDVEWDQTDEDDDSSDCDSDEESVQYTDDFRIDVSDVEEVLDVDWDPSVDHLLYLVKWKGYDSSHNSWQSRGCFKSTCDYLLINAVNRCQRWIDPPNEHEVLDEIAPPPPPPSPPSLPPPSPPPTKRSRSELTKEQLLLDKQKWIAKCDKQNLERLTRRLRRNNNRVE